MALEAGGGRGVCICETIREFSGYLDVLFVCVCMCVGVGYSLVLLSI